MIHPKLESYIATRDRKIAKYWPHDRAHIRNLFVRLLEKGAVTVGGRSTCGGSDPTMHAYRAWNEVVRKARALAIRSPRSRCAGSATPGRLGAAGSGTRRNTSWRASAMTDRYERIRDALNGGGE